MQELLVASNSFNEIDDDLFLTQRATILKHIASLKTLEATSSLYGFSSHTMSQYSRLLF
jgi:hypothetical protein